MMKQLFSSLALFAGLLLSDNAASQNLNPGDVVIIGYASDAGPDTSLDEFSWVPLVNLQAGTKIYFTDAGYNTVDMNFMGTGETDEILLRYIVPPGGIAAGTVFNIIQGDLPADFTAISGTKFGNDGNGIFSFPNAGDQLTIFQSTDDENNPTFGNTDFTALFMVNGSSLSFTALATNQAGITPATDVDNVTNLAPGLTDGVNAIAVGVGMLQNDESDNARYEGMITGTRDEILAAVVQLSNWQRYDAAFGNDLVIGDVESGWANNDTTSFDLGNLSIDQNNDDFQLVISPNPVKNRLNIQSTLEKNMTTATILDLNGRIITESKNPIDSIDVSALSAGIYVLKIFWDDQTISSKKIIKK